ncbi:hypothetical protein H2200_010988 [Cladophialophora chaetospira]|uniref:NAD(P)-binding protein n=1 Tax=Cladophialophora chaetospira TaxID=386627 RepID=A0AA38X175_9EURO|nr:hypothetical protein H2200_010988 [Cladophialophora chaetospira]
MGSTSTPKTWLITGASQGLGLAMTLAALNAGHKVIAGARDPVKAAKSSPDVEKLGGQWLKLDVDSTDTKQVVSKASEDVGGFDVVVNNAGYFPAGTIEDMEEDEMQAAFNTMFWGPIRVLKGALPSMRARKSGIIIYIGSIFGFYPCPTGAMYTSPKAAAEMLQSTLGVELAPFNIRTITINAGLYRTNVMTNTKMPAAGFNEAYMTSGGILPDVMGTVGKIIQDPESNMPGDPAKFGARIVDIVDGTGWGAGQEKRSNFLFGRDAVKMSSQKMQWLTEDFNATRDLAYSTDFEGSTSDGVAVVADMIQK